MSAVLRSLIFAYRIAVCNVRCVYLVFKKTLLQSSACTEESNDDSKVWKKTQIELYKVCKWNPRAEPAVLAKVLQQWDVMHIIAYTGYTLWWERATVTQSL